MYFLLNRDLITGISDIWLRRRFRPIYTGSDRRHWKIYNGYSLMWFNKALSDYDHCYTNYYYLQLGHFEMPWRRKNHHSIWHFEIGWTHFSNLQVYYCWCMSTCGCQAKDNTSAYTFHNRCIFWSYDNVPVSIAWTDHLPGFWLLCLHTLFFKIKTLIQGL